MNPLPHDESEQRPTLLCRICNEPVPIEIARTDSDGKAVHSDCYLQKLNDHDGHIKEQKRSWSVVAKELSEERDSGKVGELVRELDKALDEAEPKRHLRTQKKSDRSD